MSGSKSDVPGSGAVEPAADEPLSFAVHSMPSPALPPRTVRQGRLKMLLVLLICAAPVIASYFTYYVIRPEGRTNHGVLIDPQREMPAALPLTGLDGRRVEPASLKGQWLLVVVAGGACDAGCEKQLYLQRQLRESLGKEKDRVDRVWLVDDDAPVRPELLPALTGASVLRAPREALAQWLNPGEGQALEAPFYVVDPMGRWMMRFPVPAEPARIKRDLEKLLRASGSWDTAGR